jgi:type I restriction-modification system DNA methylase subunit
MALYQVSVLNTYLKLQDKDLVEKAYKKYTKYFHNATIQENIKGSKEEEYQGIFLTELFDTILGYTLSPKPEYNLVAEYKNQNNSRKADGAILVNGNALAVIELKGTNTKDLESIRKQAFDYKANQKGCVYVITSNFEKLRFYINDATEFEEFNLFTLTLEEFALLYLCLSKDAILSNLPLKIKEESVTEEEQITKKFYADYSVFKRELYRDLVKQNAKRLKSTNVTSSDSQSELYRDADEQKQLEKNVKLALFKKSQKLIDRFLFIFFAEDRGLLPANSTIQILDDWQKLKDLDAIVPLYDRFKLYFKYLDEGRKGTSQKAEIYAYNGGLFKPDSILDNLLIDDVLLSKHARKLANYDFESQVDVNILGHIFENSLNEIESVNAEIEGGEFDKQKSKRKKDGVFYTPKYITKYIVENTVGKLCQEKKTELGFKEEEYYKSRTNRPKKKLQELVNVLDTYREWLLQLTICDPACGSGAFLNQALDFLIKEHRYIDELKANVLGGGLVFSDIENTILENNIYGVDLNDESVEIAKLSLWLRTAQPRRKLNDLNSNIKCGNSLIDSKAVAGDKAFNWEIEFPQIFKKGGFDVVIGNPPYVDIKALDVQIVKELFKKFETSENRINLYSIFIEKGFKLLNNKGCLSFINPNSILVNSSYTKIRKLLLKHMTSIIKLPDDVFKDAKVETIIFELRKNSKLENVDCIIYNKEDKISFIDNNLIKSISKNEWMNNESWNYNIYISPEQQKIINKIHFESKELNEVADFTLGITPYDKYKGHSKEIIKNRAYHSNEKINKTYKPIITGENITRYFVDNTIKEYISYGEWLGAPREERFFTEPRILIRQIVSGKPPRIYAGFTNEDLYYTQIGFGIIPKGGFIQVKSLLCLLNSKLINFYHKFCFLDLEKELFQKILIANCKKFPIKKITKENENVFNQKADIMFFLNKDLQETSNKFQRTIQRKFDGLEKLPKKLESWYELTYAEFIKELAKKKIKLTLSEEAEWETYFNAEQQKAQALQSQITQTDKEIDQMVYELYGLTEDEIAIVENS